MTDTTTCLDLNAARAALDALLFAAGRAVDKCYDLRADDIADWLPGAEASVVDYQRTVANNIELSRTMAAVADVLGKLDDPLFADLRSRLCVAVDCYGGAA